jgi:hypothetical protein
MRLKSIILSGAALLVSVVMMNCAGNLTVDRMYAEPQPVSQGEDLTLYVVIEGATDKVDRVVGTVREYTEMRTTFKNDGTNGDETANDNVWTYQTPISWDTPTGTYHIDVSVYNQQGEEIVTEGYENRWTGKTGTIELTIE